MGFGLIQGMLTIVLMVLFIGIVAWAYSGRQKRRFDEASMLPFVDETRGVKGRRAGGVEHD